MDEEPDAPPSGIDLPLGKAESAGRGGGVVIVVKAFAYHEPGQPLIVGRQVVEWSSSKTMANPIDRPSTEKVVGGMDSGCHKRELPAKQKHEEAHTQAKAHQRVVEEKSIPAISRKIAGISGHRRRVAGHFPVQQGVGELYARITQDDGGMGISLGVGERMVLAMYRDPLLWPRAGARPNEHSTHRSNTRGEL